MIACTAVCNMRLFLGPAGGIGFSQLPWATYRLPTRPTLATRIALCFSEKQPFKDHAAVPAMVKRESLELGALRNWLLTRTSPTSNTETYTQSQWQNPPRCSQRRSMPDARLQAPGGRLDDLLAAVKRALRLYSEASRPLTTATAARG